MNKKTKNKWLKALKSGKYIQGSGLLREERAGIVCHCCLGVLADVMGEEINRGGDDILGSSLGKTMYDDEFIKGRDGLVNTLWETNDDSHKEGERNYESVIKIIEKIVTKD
jgi:hypothetical protein